MAPEDMTSKEYYLDSSAHFAVHEVRINEKVFFDIIRFDGRAFRL